MPHRLPMTASPTLPACVTIDAVGTLFGLRESVGQTYADHAKSHGLTLDPMLVDLAFRRSWKALPPPEPSLSGPSPDDDKAWWQTLVTLTLRSASSEPVSQDLVARLFADLYDYYATAEAWTLYEDTLPALQLLQGKTRLLALSNFDRRLHPILESLGLRNYFEHVIISSEVGAWKPHPRIFAQVTALTGLPPSSCLHIGDDERCDLQGAQAAGMSAVLLHRPDSTLLEVAGKILAGEYSSLQEPIL
jgi:putative hydrolase of the HAD superfamily